MAASVKVRRGGRPPKFDEPRRPVTMTLPERTLDLLAAIDPDRASAVVRLVAVTPGRYLLTVVAGTLIESPLASPPSFGPAEAREEHVDQTEIPVPSVNCFMQK